MSGHTLLLGHRGTRVSDSAAENTLAAFDLALQLGCDGFEFDVRRTACGTAVICHDEKVHGLNVAKAARGQLESLPRLGDVLAFFCDRKQTLDRCPDQPVEYVIPKYTLVTVQLVQAVHRASKTLLTWTVNDEKTMRRLADWGVDGIIADDPHLLVKTLPG